jgi:hypothetical protein
MFVQHKAETLCIVSGPLKGIEQWQVQQMKWFWAISFGTEIGSMRIITKRK